MNKRERRTNEGDEKKRVNRRERRIKEKKEEKKTKGRRGGADCGVAGQAISNFQP